MAIFCAPKPGTFRVLAWTATGDTPGAPALCIIEIRDPQDNPDKKPTEPKPQTDLSPLIEALNDIPAADRAEALLPLAKIYRKGERLARERSVASLGELRETLVKQATLTLDPEALLPVRRILAELTLRELGNKADEPLAGPIGIKAARWFAAIAQVLEKPASSQKDQRGIAHD